MKCDYFFYIGIDVGLYLVQMFPFFFGDTVETPISKYLKIFFFFLFKFLNFLYFYLALSSLEVATLSMTDSKSTSDVDAMGKQ